MNVDELIKKIEEKVKDEVSSSILGDPDDIEIELAEEEEAETEQNEIEFTASVIFSFEFLNEIIELNIDISGVYDRERDEVKNLKVISYEVA